MLMPKRVKHRKVQRGRRAGMAKGGNSVSFGEFGLKAVEVCWITSRQIEAARRAITHHIKRGGKVWIRIFPDKPVTTKPAETRMGSGKGAPDHWVAVVKPGRVLFEMAGVPRADRPRGDAAGRHKLPIATKFVVKERTRTWTVSEIRQPRRDPRPRGCPGRCQAGAVEGPHSSARRPASRRTTAGAGDAQADRPAS